MALIDELKEWRTATSAEMDRLEAAGREIDQKWKEQERLFGDLDTAIRALDPLDPPTDEEMFGDSDFEAEKAVAREQLEREPEIPAGFTKWEGGEMPAEIDGVAVDYIMTGDGRAFSSDAAFLRWARNGDPDDIIAYRIIEASPAPDPDEQDDASEFISKLTGDPAIEPEAGLHDFGFAEHAEAERRADGWIPEGEFTFPKTQAIVEARWEDGYCETLSFEGYTPTTHEPEWSSPRFKGDNPPEDHTLVTHYRSYPLPERPALNEAMQDERELTAPPTNPDADFWARGLTEQPKSRLNIFGIDFSGKPKVEA